MPGSRSRSKSRSKTKNAMEQEEVSECVAHIDVLV